MVQRTILSGNSPADRFDQGGETGAIPEAAQRGLLLFREKPRCTKCHSGFNFTDEKFHNTGIAWARPPGTAAAAESFRDEGRAAVTGRADERGAFKTPTLREVEHSAPYMHDGSLASLDEVVDYYDRGGNKQALLDEELRPIGFTASEKHALVAFLRSLSGTITK